MSTSAYPITTSSMSPEKLPNPPPLPSLVSLYEAFRESHTPIMTPTSTAFNTMKRCRAKHTNSPRSLISTIEKHQVVVSDTNDSAIEETFTHTIPDDTEDLQTEVREMREKVHALLNSNRILRERVTQLE